MNHLKPRQKEGDGKWHYTSHNKRTGTYPIGYCADGCPGHDTAEDAAEHYRQYLLDNLRFTDDDPNASSQHRCEAEGCDVFTSGAADAPGCMTRTLCAAHRNREAVDALLVVGEAWTS